MKTIFIVIAIILTGITSTRADNYSDIAQFAQSICADIPEGKLTRNSIQGKVGANSGLLARLISGDMNVSGAKIEEIYKGIPFDKLPDQITTVSMCKIEVVRVLLTQKQGTVNQDTSALHQNGNGNIGIVNNGSTGTIINPGTSVQSGGNGIGPIVDYCAGGSWCPPHLRQLWTKSCKN